MTITKAIEILHDLLREGPQFPPDDRREAVKLGILALQHYQEVRTLKVSKYYPLLPGETEE